MTPTSDSQLLIQSATDTGAFNELVVRWQVPLRAYFIHQGSSNHADDLTQQTLLKLFKSRHRYQAKAQFSTFLFTIARHVQIDHWRSCGRYQELLSDYQEQPTEQRANHNPVVLDLPAALAQLPEKQRTVVEAIFIQDKSYLATAQALDIPEGTVKSRLHHALRRLRQYFAERSPHEANRPTL